MSADTRSVMDARTNRPFATEVNRLLKERGISTRALAVMTGVSQPHLSRLLRQADYKKTPSLPLARSVARALNLPEDYFREYREAYVIDQIRRRPRLRDEIYESVRPK
jgi:transcriptional regulator with XRE-family HTH domain